MRVIHGHGTGFSLVELLLAMAVASLLSAGLLQAVQAGSTSYRLQANISALAENARFALQAIRREAEQASFSEQPWAQSQDAGLEVSVDQVSARGDRLAFRRRSNRNCYDNPNPVLAANGQPAFFLLETRFQVNTSGNLSLTCRYGPDPGQMVTQVNSLGLVEYADNLQALFAEDTDGDGRADGWVRAGQWENSRRVLGMRVGLLLASAEQVASPPAESLTVLDESLPPVRDGRLRRAFESSFAIRGRRP